jgi:bifunctional polynucleotide phosphatase/kinase
MWEYMMKDQNGNVDLESSFLVGDAAGRAKDHSDSDTHFCINVGIQLFTPEEFFLGSTPEVIGHKFDPGWHLAANGTAHGKIFPWNGSVLKLIVLKILPLSLQPKVRYSW